LSKVVILMPVFQPKHEYLVAQLRSIQSQTLPNFRCVVAFDGPFQESARSALSLIDSDSRFQILEFQSRLGLYRHIERMLRTVIDEAQYIALADQDDIWDDSRIADQLRLLQSHNAGLVTDNARLIGEDSKSLNLDLFQVLRISRETLRFGFTTNFATGAGSLYHASLIRSALPFPEDYGCALHDHWLTCVGLATGDCLLTEQPTWSYRQHPLNQLGAFSGRRRYSPTSTLLKKISEIVFNRNQLLERQIATYTQTAKERFGSLGAEVCDPLARVSIKEQMNFLTPRSLSASRLETLRIVLRRFAVYEPAEEA